MKSILGDPSEELSDIHKSLDRIGMESIVSHGASNCCIGRSCRIVEDGSVRECDLYLGRLTTDHLLQVGGH